MSTNDDKTTVGDLFKMAQKYNAGVMKVIPRDEGGKATGCIIVCDSASAEEVLAAVEELEEEWDEEDDSEEDTDRNDVSSDEPEAPKLNPVPLRVRAPGAGSSTVVLGLMEISDIDASVIFGEHDALEITFSQEQMKQLASMFHEYLHGEE